MRSHGRGKTETCEGKVWLLKYEKLRKECENETEKFFKSVIGRFKCGNR